MPQDPLTLGLAGGCAALALALAGALLALRSAKAALAESRRLLAAPKPPRLVEGRGERFGLLWFPQLSVDDAERKVVSAAAGRPYCPKCLITLSLLKGPPEEWACAGCHDRRAGSAADITVMDQIVAQAIQEFVVRNAGYRAVPGLPQLARAAER